MYATNYHRVSSVDEAVKLKASAEDSKFVSGGMTLIPTMKQRLAAPSDLIDLRHVADMKGISVSGGKVRIGAATTHADVASSAELKSACSAICDLAAHIGDPHVRHMGTIGGSIANNDPAADYPAAMLALGATIVTSKREIAAGDFFTGMFETALEDDEIVTAVTFDLPEKAAVFVAKTAGGARVAVTGAGSNGVFRHEGMEQALSGNWSADALSGTSVDPSGMLSDLHGSAEYRANLVKVMAKRAVAAA